MTLVIKNSEDCVAAAEKVLPLLSRLTDLMEDMDGKFYVDGYDDPFTLDEVGAAVGIVFGLTKESEVRTDGD